MALITTAKASSANSNTPSKVVTRQEVSIARPTASSARAEALKARLTGQPAPQPVAPRPARSSARAEEFSKAQKFTTPPPQQAKPLPAKTSARIPQENLEDIVPPPSGLAPGQEIAQPNSTVEVPKPTTEASSESLDPQYVALARKERQLRKAQQEFKAAQDAWKQEQANYIPKAQLTSDTLKVLAEAGITPDKLVELQLNQAAPQDPNQPLLDKISQLEAKLNGLLDPENGTLAQRDKEAYSSVVEQIRQDAKLVVDSNPAFGLTKSEGQTEEVVKLVTQWFEDFGKVLDVDKAAEMIEQKLEQRLVEQYERLSKYEKINKARKAPEEPEAIPAQPTQSQSPRVNTLTNEGASQRPLSARDRAVLKVQEAINASKRK